MMNSLRNYIRTALGPYLGVNPASKAQKYLFLARTIYCFSAGTLFILVIGNHEKQEGKEKEQTKEGESKFWKMNLAEPTNKRQSFPPGIYFEYYNGVGMKRLEFDKDRCLEELKQEDIEKEKAKEVTQEESTATAPSLQKNGQLEDSKENSDTKTDR